MANSSIYNAFERMWQHTNTMLDQKQEEIPNLYVWRKYSGNPQYYETKADGASITSAAAGMSSTISYASDFDVIDGKFSLINPQKITVESSNDTQLALIKGKYVASGLSSFIYLIGDNATFSRSSSSTYTWSITASRATKITINDGTNGVLGYVSSKSFNAYPADGEHTDGYWYKYYRQLGDAAVVDGSSVAFTETDPTVPAWAKEANKPTYTASEVGALPDTTNYAGSSSAGGSATSADKLNTNAGSATQPVYFSNGVPIATTHTLEASVPSNAKFTDTIYIHPIYSSAKDNGLYKVTVDDNGHVSDTIAVTKNDITALGLTASDVGALPDTTVIPTELPNPNALTFTGAVTGIYDGSEPLSIEIPESGTVTDEQIATAVTEYLKDNPITGGNLIITDDENGNVSIESVGSTTIVDDGLGNITIL